MYTVRSAAAAAEKACGRVYLGRAVQGRQMFGRRFKRQTAPKAKRIVGSGPGSPERCGRSRRFRILW